MKHFRYLNNYTVKGRTIYIKLEIFFQKSTAFRKSESVLACSKKIKKIFLQKFIIINIGVKFQKRKRGRVFIESRESDKTLPVSGFVRAGLPSKKVHITGD